MKFNSSKDSLEWFRGNLTSLVDSIRSLNYETKYSVLNKLNEQAQTSSSSSSSSSSKANTVSSTSYLSTIYWMLQDPIDEYKYSFNKSITEQITNKQIDLYNRAAISIL